MNGFSSRISAHLACCFRLAAIWSSLVAVGYAGQQNPYFASPVPGRACFALGQNELLGFMDTTGRLVTEPAYWLCSGPDGWWNGHLWVEASAEPFSGTFIRSDGTPISPPKFGSLQILSPGYNPPVFDGEVALVAIAVDKSAYVDRVGRILFEGKGVCRDEEGLLDVFKDGKYGYATVTGTVVIASRFDFADGFKMGMAHVKLAGKDRVIRRDGTCMGGDGHEFVKIASQSKRTFWVGVNGRIGLADDTGRLLSDALFDEILDMDHTWRQSTFVREVDGLWGLLDKGGTFLVPPSFLKVGHFRSFDPFKQGYAKVTGEGGVGLIDETGVFHAPCRFEDVESFVPGKAFAKKDGKWGLVGKDGAFLLDPQFDGVNVRSGDLALVYVLRESYSLNRGSHMEEKWGVVTSDGRIALKSAFAGFFEVASTAHDLVKIWNGKWDGMKYGLVNFQTGTPILPLSYDSIDAWGRDLYAARHGEYVGLVTAKGDWRLPLTVMVDSLPSSFHNNHSSIHATSAWLQGHVSTFDN